MKLNRFALIILSCAVLILPACDFVDFSFNKSNAISENSINSDGSGFDNSNTEESKQSQESKDYSGIIATLEEIKGQLPSSIDGNLTLPKINKDGYEVEYSCLTVTIDDNIVLYQSKDSDFTFTLTITVKYNGLECSDTFDIIMRKKDMTTVLNNYMAAYKKKFKAEIKTDYVIPHLKYDGIKCVVRQNGVVVPNNIYKYDFPSQDKMVRFDIQVINESTYQMVEDYVEINVIKESVAKVTPVLYIDTNGQSIWSKETYVNGKVTLKEANSNAELVTTLDNVSMQIRGRGNSTWGLPKKPYKLKFDEKTSLFGEKAQKDWVLLANYCDQTLLRDYLAKTIGSTLNGLAFTPSCHFVDVYLNNEYEGNYMITDQVEVKSGRVDVERNSASEDTGYLIELDQRLYDEERNNKDKTWFEISVRDSQTRQTKNMPYAVKYPKTDEEYYSISQLNFIKSYINQAFQALNNSNGWEDYIDLESSVDYFIVSELFKNVDVGYASFFIYKDKGDKLFFGPLWDFDLSSLNQGHLDYNSRQYPEWYASRWDKNGFFYFLMKQNAFKKEVKRVWEEIYPTLYNDFISLIDNQCRLFETSRINNFKKWDIIGKNRDWYTSDEVYNAKTYDAQITLLKGWFSDRINWMNTEIKKF